MKLRYEKNTVIEHPMFGGMKCTVVGTDTMNGVEYYRLYAQLPRQVSCSAFILPALLLEELMGKHQNGHNPILNKQWCFIESEPGVGFYSTEASSLGMKPGVTPSQYNGLLDPWNRPMRIGLNWKGDYTHDLSEVEGWRITITPLPINPESIIKPVMALLVIAND